MSEVNQPSFRVLSLEDLEPIQELELHRLKAAGGDPIEAQLNSWTAPWRRESLEHYLPLGWSFGAFLNGKLIGYCLGQPFLFLAGNTQTLWVESVTGPDPMIESMLAEVAIRWGRDKHFQRVSFGQAIALPSAFSAEEKSDFGLISVRTTKSSR